MTCHAGRSARALPFSAPDTIWGRQDRNGGCGGAPPVHWNGVAYCGANSCWRTWIAGLPAAAGTRTATNPRGSTLPGRPASDGTAGLDADPAIFTLKRNSGWRKKDGRRPDPETLRGIWSARRHTYPRICATAAYYADITQLATRAPLLAHSSPGCTTLHHAPIGHRRQHSTR